MTATRDIAAPSGYGERARRCIRHLERAHSLLDIAALLDVTPRRVYAWRAGSALPADPQRLADACGVPVSLVLCGPDLDLSAALRTAGEDAAERKADAEKRKQQPVETA